MPGRSRRIVGVVLLCLAPWGGREASAGSMTYSWQPLAGSGYIVTYPGNQCIPFDVRDACLTIEYDPDHPADSSILLSSGQSGYEVTAYQDVQIEAFSGSLLITGSGDGGQFAAVSFIGCPGPLNAQGVPDSLGSLADAIVLASARGGYHDQFAFNAQSVPEPSGLALAAIALAFLAAWGRRGGRKNEPRMSTDGHGSGNSSR